MARGAKLAAVLLGAVIGSGGCSRCDRGRASDVQIVARSLTDTAALAVLEDGTVVLDTGVYVYRVPDAGAIELVGERSSYAPFLPADDGTPLVRARARSFFGTKDAPMMLEYGEAFALTNRVWTKTQVKPPATPSVGQRMRGRRSESSTAILPADVQLEPKMVRTSYRRYPSGLLVGIGTPFVTGAGSPMPTGLVVKPGARAETLVPFPDATTSWKCELVSSADEKAYADCTTAGRAASSERRLYVLDDRTWARVLLPSRDLDAPIAVTKDGAVWMGLGDPARLAVRANGRISYVTLPKPPQTLARASYVARKSDNLLPYPQKNEVSELSTVADLAAARDGSLVVVAREENIDGGMIVLRVGTRGAPPVAFQQVVGTEIDQLVDIRNGDEPKRWVGHCQAVFVQLPRGRDAGELALHPITHGTWVEGRLHDKTMTGIVFTDGKASGEDFERVISAFVERSTTNPASPPEVTCTLPVLDDVK